MPFVPLDQQEEQPRRGFVPLETSSDEGGNVKPRGFVPLDPERPSILKMAALENPATAIAETGLNLASQAVALPVAGIAGLATEAGNALGLTERKGADVVHAVGDALTYQPRGEMGKQATEIATYPFQKLAEAGQWAGGKTLDATGSPALATAVDTAIQGVLPMVAGPMAKKGGSAIRERFSKPETGAEAIAPESQATNAAPAMAEAARPAESALAFDSAIPAREMIDGVFRTETEIPSRIHGVVEHEGALPKPEAQTVESIRRPGDQGLRGVDEQLRAVSETRGSEAQPGASPIAPGSGEGLRTGERGLGDTQYLGNAEAPIAGRDVAGGREAGVGRGALDRGETFGAADHAPAGTDYARTVAQQTAVLDPNAGPLSRSAAIARPDLVIRAKEANPAGPFGNLIPDSGTVREAARPTEPKAWVGFADDSGSLGVPRAEMPQIKAEHRGAMTQFMNARGIKHRAEEVRADLLKPTQAEFSPAKVKNALGFEGGERSILVSSDGYILDGHHQWLAKRAQGKTVDVIRFDAPIADLFKLSHDFPSSQKAKGARAEPARGFTPIADTQRAAPPGTEYSFAPGANYAPLIDDSRTPAGTAPATAVGRDKPIRREDVIVPFAKDLGASIYSVLPAA